MTAPSAPVLSARHDGHKVYARWKSVPDATSYRLYVQPSTGATADAERPSANPGMESSPITTNWYSAGMANTITRVATTPHSGSWAAELQRNAAAGTGQMGLHTAIWQNAGTRVEPGNYYAVKAWRRSTVARSGSTRILWYDLADINLGENNAGVTNGSGSWIEQTMSAVAPPRAHHMRVGFWFDAVPEGEPHWVDDMWWGPGRIVTIDASAVGSDGRFQYVLLGDTAPIYLRLAALNAAGEESAVSNEVYFQHPFGEVRHTRSDPFGA